MNNRMQEKVREFCRRVVSAPTSPAEPALRDARLRARLVLEEAIETAVGLVGDYEAFSVLDEIDTEVSRKLVRDGRLGCAPDLVEAVDGLCDLIYVALGTAEAIGVDIEPYFDLVHGANMQKTSAAVDSHGKRGGKPDGWEDPKAQIRNRLAFDGRLARTMAEWGAFWDAEPVTDDMVVSVQAAAERRDP
jgi:predicted HAD superfamily Cof-like phosphohydrolase